MSIDNDGRASPLHRSDITRKISSISDHGHDNPTFESPRSRKVSSTSDHAGIGPVRKKSILHNAQTYALESPNSGSQGNIQFKEINNMASIFVEY